LGIPASCTNHELLIGHIAKSFVYLQLGKGETTTGTDTAVVLDGRAPHNGTQLVDGARGNSGGLRETGLTTAVLATGLYPKETLSVHHAQKIVQNNSSRQNFIIPCCLSDTNSPSDRFEKAYLLEVHADTTLPVLVEVYNKTPSVIPIPE
jgi:hypothetical protein